MIRPRLRLRESRIGRIVIYGSTRSVGEALLGLRGVLLAGLLGPEAFGIWALFRMVLTYGNFAGLGLVRGLELEVAKTRADRDGARRIPWGRTAVGCELVIFGSVAILALIAGVMTGTPWLRQLLWAVAAGLLPDRLWAYCLTYLRAAGSLRDFALLELLQVVAQIVLTLTLAQFFGLDGAFAGFALALASLLLAVRSRVPLRPQLERARVEVMLAVGLPLSATQLLSAMLATVDRLAVGAWLGLAALGQYAFAVSVASLGVTAALVVQTVVFPDVYGRLEREGASEVNRKHLDRTIRTFALVLAPLAGAGVLVLGLVIARLLPQYTAALQPASVFVFAGVAQGVVGLCMVSVVAGRRQKVLPLFTLAALVANAASAYATLALGYGMAGLAIGAVVARLIYAGGVVALVAAGAAMHPVATAVKVLWPIAWCAGAIAVVSGLIPVRDLTSCALALASYLALLGPIYVALARAHWGRVPISGR